MSVCITFVPLSVGGVRPAGCQDPQGWTGTHAAAKSQESETVGLTLPRFHWPLLRCSLVFVGTVSFLQAVRKKLSRVWALIRITLALFAFVKSGGSQLWVRISTLYAELSQSAPSYCSILDWRIVQYFYFICFCLYYTVKRQSGNKRERGVWHVASVPSRNQTRDVGNMASTVSFRLGIHLTHVKKVNK